MSVPEPLLNQWDLEALEADRQIDLAAAWAEPSPLPGLLPDVPSFNAALLPDALRPWIMDVSERVQCPPDYPAAGLMVSLSAVVGRQVAIRPNQHDDWTVVPNLWGAIIGPPGQLKTPALAEALKPITMLEIEARKSFDLEQAEFQAMQAVEKQQTKVIELEIHQACKAKNHQKARDLALAAQQDQPEMPKRRRYMTQDGSVEKIGELLEANPRGLMVSRDELSGWFRVLNKAGHENDRAFYLEAWNGNGRYTYDRIGRGTLDIEAACISIIGGIQPGPLRAYIQDAMKGGAGDDGLLQRLQVAVWPDPPRKWREVDRKPDLRAREFALETFRRLDQIDPDSIGADTSGPIPFCRFSRSGFEVWREFRANLEYRLRNENYPPAFEAALSKQRSLTPSIALLIHLADNPQGGPVTERATLQAIAWTEYLEGHAKRLYAPALDRAAYAGKLLGERIRAGALKDLFSARDVYRNGWSGLDAGATDLALHYLESIGWVKRIEEATDGRTGTKWRINPKVKS